MMAPRPVPRGIMGKKSRRINRGEGLFTATAVIVALLVSGCHDWPDERVTAIQAESILHDLSKIRTIPDSNIPIPEVYKIPPKKTKQIVGGAEEWKLFYFCQYHTSDKLKEVIHEQFATKLFDEKGKSTSIRDYTVTSNSDINQLIVRCPSESDINAVLDVLNQTDVPPVQVRIDCLVSELYADLTVDRETSLKIENLFGEQISLGGKEDSTGELLPAFPGAALRDSARAKFGLKVGFWRNQGVAGHEFRALIDLLVSRGYLKILMNPSLEVVNGQTAEIHSTEQVPLQQIYLRGGTGSESWIETKTEYVDVVDSLEITPHVYADGYIGLETKAKISAKLAPEGITQLPIVTERQITNKDNRIRHGESLIIGGIRKTEKRDVIRGVPLLKDIPILNILFSGRDFEERAKEVVFIITPSVSTGGIPNAEMTEYLKGKHENPETDALHEAMTDPFGLRAREKARELRIEKAEQTQQETEANMAMARQEVRSVTEQIEKVGEELQKAKVQVHKATTAAEKAQAEAKKATARAEKAISEAEKAKSDAEQVKIEAQKATAKAEQAISEAEKAKNQAEQIKDEAEKAKARAEQAKKRAEQLKQEKEKAQSKKEEQSPESNSGSEETKEKREKSENNGESGSETDKSDTPES